VALAAAGTALALALVPGLSGEAQTALFAALSVVFTFVGRAALRRPGVARPGLNRRASALTGRRARVVGDFATGIGAVEIDGLRWRARLDVGAEGEGEGDGADGQAGPPAPREGDMVAILGADGVVLRVAPD
jgi:membrane protein implicated in regulation of membrane protease activity